MKKVLLKSIPVIAVFIVLIVYFKNHFHKSSIDSATQTENTEQTDKNNTVTKGAEDPIDGFDQETRDYIDNLVSEITTRFANKTDDPATWITLFDIKDYLLEEYSEGSGDIFNYVLQMAFGDKAGAMFDIVEKIDLYQKWYTENQFELSSLLPAEREQLMWQKREELLGDSAHEIWSPYLMNEPERHFKDRLNALGKAESISIDDKLFVMETFLNDAIQNGGLDPIRASELDNPSVKTMMFFSSDSVQKDLAKMTSDERHATLRNVRESMGLPDEVIDKLEKRDQLKEMEWKLGDSYSEEKAKIMASDEPDKDKQLKKLRSEYFSETKAEVIRKEEERGFYRYEIPRVFGVN